MAASRSNLIKIVSEFTQACQCRSSRGQLCRGIVHTIACRTLVVVSLGPFILQFFFLLDFKKSRILFFCFVAERARATANRGRGWVGGSRRQAPGG